MTLSLLDELRSRIHGELSDRPSYIEAGPAGRNALVDVAINRMSNVQLLGILESMTKVRILQCQVQSTC